MKDYLCCERDRWMETYSGGSVTTWNLVCLYSTALILCKQRMCEWVISCMHYLQLAKLWWAGSTQIQQHTSIHSSFIFCTFPILSHSFLFFPVTSCLLFSSHFIIVLFCSAPLFLYVFNWLSVFENSITQNNASKSLQLYPNHRMKMVNLDCRPFS